MFHKALTVAAAATVAVTANDIAVDGLRATGATLTAAGALDVAGLVADAATLRAAGCGVRTSCPCTVTAPSRCGRCSRA